MRSRLIRLLLLTSVCLANASRSWAEGTEPAAAPADYAVLTPAVEGRFHVASGVDLTAFVSPMGIGNLGDQRQTRSLRALVERDRYDPAARFADRLVQSLVESGFSAVHEPIARRPAGRVQSLAWGDLPQVPRGNVMIDVTISWVCLCSDVAFTRFWPAISLRWRLLGPGQDLIEPSHHLVYYHYPAFYQRRKSQPGDSPPDPSTIPPEAVVSDSCGYRSAKAAGDDPEGLWGCMDAALQAAANRMVFDLKKAAE